MDIILNLSDINKSDFVFSVILEEINEDDYDSIFNWWDEL